jgi:hypothetical protein
MDDLNVSGDVAQGRVQRLINAVSNAIERYCGKTFQVQANFTEAVTVQPGVIDPAEQGALTTNPITAGVTRLVLSLVPVLYVSQVTNQNDIVPPAWYVIEDALAGFLFNQFGWTSDPVAYIGTARDVMTGYEDPQTQATYTAGYVLPNQATISWPGANMSVAAGAVLLDPNGNYWTTPNGGTTGSVQPSWSSPSFNNQIGAATAAVVMPNDGSVIWVGVPPLPSEIEEACARAVVTMYRERGFDLRVTSEQVMEANVKYTERNAASGEGEGGMLPDFVLAQLQPYRRLL